MKKTYNIKGMHCVSCEIIIGDNIKNIKNIKKSEISHKTCTATIEFDGEAPNKEMKEAIIKSGFELLEGEEVKKDETVLYKNILQNILIFLSVGFIIFLISKVEISRFYPDISENVNLLIALGLGVVASLSTCLALTGGIIMGFSAKTNLHNENPSLLTRAKPQLYFHAGRLVGFFILGGLLGLFGNAIGFSLSAMTILIFAVAIVMFYLGLNIMGLVPNITSLGFHLPKGLAMKIKAQENKDHAFVPALLGILTFFLPCGFTQSMQLSAVASGSFIGGALLMLFFALGTMPILFSVGFGSSFAQNRDFRLAKKFIGAFIIFFAIYSFNNALVLSGSSFTLSPSQISANTDVEESTRTKDSQTVKMDIDYVFKQTEFKIVKDVPVVWEINAINLTGCSNEVIIPSLSLSTGKMKKGINTLEFTPTKTGVIPFSCWMGMLSGRFIVVDSESALKNTTNSNIEFSSIQTSSAPSASATCNGSCGSPTCGGATPAGCGCGG